MRRPTAAGLALLLAAVACAPRPGPFVPEADGAGAVPPAPIAPVPTPRPAFSLFAVAYAVAPERTAAAVPLFRRVVDPATLAVVGGDEPLGAGLRVAPVRGGDALLVEDAAAPAISLVGSDGVRRPLAAHGDLPVSLETPGGRVYLAEGDTVRVVDRYGRVLEAFLAPRAKSGPSSLPNGRTVAVRADASAVQAFLADDRATYAVVSGPANTAVVDLARGDRVDLDGFAALDATLSSGHAYVLGWHAAGADRIALELADVDLAGASAPRRTPLAVSGPVAGARVVATSAGAVYAYLDLAARDAPAPRRSVLVRLEAPLAPVTLALPDDLGSDAVLGVDDALYVFGGPGRNVVTRVDANGSLTRYAVAPAGASVQALVVR